MIIHKWGLIPYEEAVKKMEEIHLSAVKYGANHLIVCQHPDVFTVGQEAWEKRFDVKTLKTDRGGSISCHSPGQNIYYFCFQSPYPARFFSKVTSVFGSFFKTSLPCVIYNKDRPGFYIHSRKLSSLGFRYKEGVSLHGVSVNVDVDLFLHNLVNPCGLEGISASSLRAEGLTLTCQEVDEAIIKSVLREFDESIQA